MLRIGHLSTFYHTSILMIAQESMGSRAEWKLYGTGPAIVQAFEDNEIDLAYIGLPPAMIGIARGVKIVCIAGGHMEGTVISGMSHFKGYPECSELAGILQQFSGKKIGVPGKGSIHDVILSDCLNRLNLSRDVAVSNYQWADQVLEAMHRGDITAAAGTPALAVAVQHYIGGKILYPPSELWPNNPSYGILASNDYLMRCREDVAWFLKLHEEATCLLRTRPEEAARSIADYVGIVDAPFILDVLQVSPKYCACLSESYIESSMKFVPALKANGYIIRDMAAEEIFDTSLIDTLHPEKDHYEEGIAQN